jgi:hypothetical protein
MEPIRIKIAKFEIKSSNKDFNAAWEVLADEMTEYFGENCYWVFYKKEHWKIWDAFKICQEKKICSFKYFMGVMKNLK